MLAIERLKRESKRRISGRDSESTYTNKLDLRNITVCEEVCEEEIRAERVAMTHTKGYW